MKKRKNISYSITLLIVQFCFVLGLQANHFDDLAPIQGKYLSKSASQIANQIRPMNALLPNARGGQYPNNLPALTRHYQVILESIKVDQVPLNNDEKGERNNIRGEKNDLEIMGLITVGLHGNRNLYRQNRGANDILFARDLNDGTLKVRLNQTINAEAILNYYIKDLDANQAGFTVKFSLFEYDKNQNRKEAFTAKDFRINAGSWSWNNGAVKRYEQQLSAGTDQRITVYFTVELIEKISDEALLSAICDNNYQLVQDLLQKGGNPSAKGALAYAIENRNQGMVDLLLDYGALPTTNDLERIMRKSNYNRQTIRELVRLGATPNDWVLQKAMEYGEGDMVGFFVQNGAKPSPNNLRFAIQTNDLALTRLLLTRIKPEHPALMEAALQNNFQMFGLLMEAGAYLQNNEPIHKAMELGNFDIVALGLQNGGNVNEAVTYAMNINQSGMVQLALDAGANPNLVFPFAVLRNDGRLFNDLLKRFRGNPNDALAAAIIGNNLEFAKQALSTNRTNPNLHISNAADIGNEQLVRLLVENRADPSLALLGTVKNDNLTLLRYLFREGAAVKEPKVLAMAAQNGNFEITELLVNEGANANDGIAQAVKENHLKVADFLLYKGAANHQLIQFPAKNGHAKMVGLLLRYGVNPNEGMPAAVDHNQIEVVELLLNKGAQPRDFIRKPAATGNPRLVKLLLNKNADPNDGMRSAVVNNQAEIVDLLLQKGATTAGYLRLAVQNTNLVIANMLLNKGAEPNDGIAVAVKTSQVKMLGLLLDFGADARRPTLMKTAVENADTDIIRLLSQNGAKANYRYNNGMNYLHFATNRQFRLSTIVAIIEAGSDLNDVDNKGNTPLHYAVMKGKDYMSVIQNLVNHGADVNAVNHGGHSIYKAAKNTKVKKYLKRNGARKKGWR